MTVERQGRFIDTDKGGGIRQGYQDATKDDPFNKKYIARNLRSYGYLKKQGLGKPKGLKKLKGKSDTQLENMAARAVLTKMGVKRRKLNTKYNKKKYNIKWAKTVMAKKAAGKTVKQQALKATRKSRAHVRRVNKNRRIMKTNIWTGRARK